MEKPSKAKTAGHWPHKTSNPCRSRGGSAARTKEVGCRSCAHGVHQLACSLTRGLLNGCSSAQLVIEGGFGVSFRQFCYKRCWSGLAETVRYGWCRGKRATPSSNPGTESTSLKEVLLIKLQRPADMPKHTQKRRFCNCMACEARAC